MSRNPHVDAVSDRPAPRRARRGRPPRISQERIVDAAIELGLDAFSMQGIAEHLGVTTPALYSHVGGRDQVLALVSAELLRRMTDVASSADNWRDWLADFAAEVRDHLAPSASALMVDLRGPATTVRLGVGERGLRLLLDAGFTPGQAGLAVWLFYASAFGNQAPLLRAYGGDVVAYLILGVAVTPLLSIGISRVAQCCASSAARSRKRL